MTNLKQTLLSEILNNKPIQNKYSKSYLNLTNAYSLEINDGFKFTKNIENKYKEISKKYNSFINNIPLIIIERYYIDNADEPKKFLFIEYDNNEFEIKVIELYEKLEEYFSDMFELSCLIVNFYNLEIKLNKGSTSDGNYI